MRYHNITKDDMLNGDGLRVVLWVSGCSHQCKGCHNPITWNPDCGLLFDEEAKAEIFDQLDKSYISGLTLSGGDPLHKNNIKEINDFIDEVKEKYPTKTIWIYSGYTYEYLQNATNEDDMLRRTIVEKCDVFCDGPFILEEKDNTCHWVGSRNQRVIRMNNITSEKDCLKPVLEEESDPKDNNYVVNIIHKKDIVKRSRVLKLA